jgi:hypothetical protein
MSQLQQLLMWLFVDSVTMTLNSLTPLQPRFSVEDKDKLELSKIDYYLQFTSSEVKS